MTRQPGHGLIGSVTFGERAIMSAVTRYVSLTAVVALLGVAAASEVKGPVHISAAGVTHYDGDTARFRAAMDADERGEGKMVADARGEARRAADEARREARHVADIARNEARRAADEARREARALAQRAAREARIQAARAMAESDEAMRTVRQRMVEARREIAERSRELNARRDELNDTHENSFDEMIEIRDGKIVRCSNPAKYPGTGCTPFTPEEKASIAAEAHAAAERASDAMAEAEAGLRAAERALREETTP